MTRSFEIQKAVRDKVVEDILKNEKNKVICRTMSKKEYTVEMMIKLIEEVRELQAIDPKNKEKFKSESGDVKAVFNNIMENNDISEEELNEVMKRKENEKGGFKKRIFLEKVCLDEGDEWIPYYEENYKEIE